MSRPGGTRGSSTLNRSRWPKPPDAAHRRPGCHSPTVGRPSGDGYVTVAAGARVRHSSMGTWPRSLPRTWSSTWSAPASRCSRYPGHDRPPRRPAPPGRRPGGRSRPGPGRPRRSPAAASCSGSWAGRCRCSGGRGPAAATSSRSWSSTTACSTTSSGSVAERGAGRGGVVRGHQVGVGAGGAVPGQAEHLRAERGEHDRAACTASAPKYGAASRSSR